MEAAHMKSVGKRRSLGGRKEANWEVEFVRRTGESDQSKGNIGEDPASCSLRSARGGLRSDRIWRRVGSPLTGMAQSERQDRRLPTELGQATRYEGLAARRTTPRA
jgi:hypothetical protein